MAPKVQRAYNSVNHAVEVSVYPGVMTKTQYFLVVLLLLSSHPAISASSGSTTSSSLPGLCYGISGTAQQQKTFSVAENQSVSITPPLNYL